MLRRQWRPLPAVIWQVGNRVSGILLNALVMTICIYVVVRFFEERDLKNAFGETYAKYPREVPMQGRLPPH